MSSSRARVRTTRWAATTAVLVLVGAVQLVGSPTVAGAVGTPPGVPTSVQAAPLPYAVAVAWSPPTSDGGSPITGYDVTLAGTSQTKSVDAATRSVSFTGLAGSVPVTASVKAKNANGAGAAASAPVTTPLGVGGAFHPLTPARILDTRAGTGTAGLKNPIGAGGTIDVAVTGQGNVPATGVSSVILNLTLTEPSAGTFVTAWPTGQVRPTTSNLNVAPAQTDPNLVEVAVGTGGKVSLFNAQGTVHAIVDVVGWVSTDPSTAPGSGLYRPLAPARILDTRVAGGSPIGQGGVIDVQIAGKGGVPATGASAVALNITVVEPTAGTFLTAYPAGLPRPVASTTNVGPHEIVPNRAVVKLGANGKISLFNAVGSANVVIDVNGWFTDSSKPGAIGAYAHAEKPARILDTRDPVNGGTAPVAAGAPRKVQVAGVGGVPSMSASVPPTAVVANITSVNTTAPTFLTVWPGGTAQPGTSDLNVATGSPIPNLVMVKLGADGSIDIASAVGSTHVIVDVMGWFLGDVVVAPNVDVLDAAATSAITGVTPTSVTFSSVPAGVKAGVVVVAGVTPKTPNGLLRRVASVAGGVATTTDAQITDAVLQGQMSFNGRPDGAPIPPALAAQAAGAPGVAPGTTGDPTATEGQWSHSFPFDQTFSGGGGSVRLNGSLDLDAMVSFDYSWQWGSPAVVQMYIDASESFVANLHAEYHGSIDQSFDLGSVPLGSITLWAGIPIVISPRANMSLHIAGNANAVADASVSQSENVQAGFYAAQGEAPQLFAVRNSQAPALTGPTFTGSVLLRGWLTPEVELRLYDRQEVSAAVNASVAALVKATWAPPTCGATLTFIVGVGYRYQLGPYSGSGSKDLASIDKSVSVACPVPTGPTGPWTGLIAYHRVYDAPFNGNSGSHADWRMVMNFQGPDFQGNAGFPSGSSWYEPFHYSLAFTQQDTTGGCVVTTSSASPGGDRSGFDGTEITYDTDHFRMQATTDAFLPTSTRDFCGTPVDPPASAYQFVGVDLPSQPSAADSTDLSGDATQYVEDATHTDTVHTTMRLTRLPDQDHDGIPDSRDAQPTVPAPLPA